MDQMLTDSFEEMVSECIDTATVRRIEAGESAETCWQELHESGFMDALVPENQGGAGLTLRDVSGMVLACGRHALPLPVAHTAVARAQLAHAGRAITAGPIALADYAAVAADGAIMATVPFGMTADWVLLQVAEVCWLLPLKQATRQRSGGHGSLAAAVRWAARPDDGVSLATRFDVRVAAAAITAGLLVGAMERVLEMSIAYANERVQFGKPIGKLQAIQQQLSVASEQTYAARSAALLGLSAAGGLPEANRVALAKSRAGEAAVQVAAISHAVHGAIGITEEYDLQLFTRRLHEWRREYGGESYWNEWLGAQFLATTDSPLDFVRARLANPA